MYKHIRPLAFRIRPNAKALIREFQTLGFPANWKTMLRDLKASQYRTTPDKEKLWIPIDSLNRALRTLAPDLIAISAGAGTQGMDDWLFSTEPLNPDTLKLIVKAWVQAEFAKAPLPNIQAALKQIDTEKLVWQSRIINLADWSAGRNGTAVPGSALLFSLLPEYAASLLSAPGVTLTRNAIQLHLVRCPLGPGQSGVELVSWPPLFKDEKKKRGPYSLLMTITIQTIPFDPEPVVYVELGIRRWIDPTDLKGKLKGNTNVYLRTGVPWLPALGNTHSFQVGQVRWRPMETQNGDKEFKLVWADKFGEILQRLNPQHQLLNPEWLRKNLNAGLVANDGTSAALVYHTRMGTHLAGAGLMPGDRHPLFEQIGNLLNEILELVAPYSRVLYTASKPESRLFDFDDLNAELCKQRRENIAGQIGAHIAVEVYYQRRDTAREVVQRLCDFLGFDPPRSDVGALKLPELTLDISCVQVGHLGSELTLSDDIKNETDRVKDAVQQRILNIEQNVTNAIHPTLSFIELAGKDEFDPGTDPKNALRIGFSHQGRVTQFIAVSGEAVEERAKRAILDGLRQLGLAPKVAHVSSIPEHPDGMNYVGVWVIRQNTKAGRNDAPRYIPVFVHLNSQSGAVRVIASGFSEWKPYRDALLALGRGQVDSFEKIVDTISFIETTVSDLVSEGNPLLLLCDAHNIRQAWKGIQDKSILLDEVSFDGATSSPIREWNGLRIVRTRGNKRHETPEWYAVREVEGEDTEVGFAEGVFRIHDRVFGGVAAKPVQFQALSKGMSKFVGGEHPAQPNKAAWNPVLYELTVAAMQGGDNAEILAAITYELRQSSIQYEEATALPLPLHLAYLMGQYVLNIDANGDSEE